MLEVFVLGQFKVEVNGGRIEIPSRPAQSLLSYLVLNAGISHRREKLAGLFWPDASESNARGYLRQSLWRIRKALESHSIDWQGYLSIDEIAIAFKASADTWLDAAQLLEQREPDAWSAQELAKAVELYRGELLPGFYDEWIEPERERIQAAFEHKVHMLLDRLVDEERWSAVMDWAERWIALGGVPEPAFRALMLAKAGQGDPPGVTGVYNRYTAALRRELDVEPSAEMTELYQQITRGALTAPVPIPSRPAFLDATAQANPVEQPLFVSRDAELAKLSAFLGSSYMGRGQVAFVTGEPGSGKTMLLQAFARQAQADDPDLIVLNGNCNAFTSAGDPYLPFLEMLEILAGDVEIRLAGGAMTHEHALRIWQLLPEVIDTLIGDGPELLDRLVSGSALFARARSGAPSYLSRLDGLLKSKATAGAAPGGQQVDLFEQYTKVLQRLARAHPLLLLVDDLQWADTGSINLLFHLGRRLPGHRILLVGAYRPEEVASGRDGSRHPLEPVLNELRRGYGDNQVDLSKAAGRQWIDALLDSEPNRLGQAFRETLFHHTNGHALFTVELLRGLQERGDLVKDEEGCWVEGRVFDWETLPPRVEAVIAESINRLPEMAQSILSTASVEGEVFTAQAVARILGIDSQEIILHLSRLLGQQHRLVTSFGVQRVGGERIARYRFRHFLFQKYLYNRLDEVEKAHFHEAMGRTLEVLYAEQFPKNALLLARHFELAGLTGQAVKYLHLAGDQAVLLYANSEAISHYQRALDLLQTLPDAPDRALLELRLRISLGVPLMATHGFTDSAVEQNNQRAVELTRQVETTSELFQVLSVLKGYYDLRLSLPAALALTEDMLKLADQLNDKGLQIHACHNMSTTLMYMGQLDGFLQYRQRASDLYDRETCRTFFFQFGFDPEVAGLAHAGWAYWILGYPEQARQQSQAALAWAEELGIPVMIAWAKYFAAQMHCYMCEFAQAQKLAMEGAALSREIGAVLFLAGADMVTGRVLAEEGHFTEAIPQLEQASTTLRISNAEFPHIQTAPLLADSYARAGKTTEGLALIEAVLKRVSATEGRIVEADLYRSKGDLLLADGSRDAEAEACFQQSIESARRIEGKSWELRAALRLCRLWQRQGKNEDAHKLLSSIYNWFSEGFDTPDLKEARLMLDELAEILPGLI